MRNFYFLLIISLFIFQISCKKDKKEESEPLNNKPNLTGTIIVQKEIGSEGGMIQGENFVVVIPPQTFTQSVVLNISKTNASEFINYALNNVYFVNNLPSNINGTITLKLKINSINDTNIFVLLCEIPWAYSANGENISYRKIEYSLSDSFIVVNINLNLSRSSNSISEKFSLGLLAITGYTSIITEGNRFSILTPTSSLQQAQELGEYLMQAFNKLTSSPLNLSVEKRTRWPIDVTICKLGADVYGYFEPSVLGNNYGSLLFNVNKLNEIDELKATAIHELMHLIQSLYDPRNAFSKAKLESPTWWLDEAVAVWSEALMFDNEDTYISKARKGNELVPLEGNIGVRPKSPQSFGYGMSAMIKYLVNKHGYSVIKQIYEKIAENLKPAEAIKESIDKFYWEWYGDFIVQYIAGNIYSDINLIILLGSKPQEVNIQNITDTSKIVSSYYKPLQTKLFKLQIGQSFVQNLLYENTGMEIISKNNNEFCYYAIFKYKTSEFQLIDFGVNPSVDQIKNLIEEGYRFLIVSVRNDYSYNNNDSKEMSFIIKFRKMLVFKSFLIDIHAYTLCPDDNPPYYSVVTFRKNRNFEFKIQQNCVNLYWEDGYFSGTINSDGSLNFTISGPGLYMYCSNLPHIADFYWYGRASVYINTLQSGDCSGVYDPYNKSFDYVEVFFRMFEISPEYEE